MPKPRRRRAGTRFDFIPRQSAALTFLTFGGGDSRMRHVAGGAGRWQFPRLWAMFPAMRVMSTVSMVLCGAALFALACSRLGWAQGDCHPSNRGMERMESARIALLNDRGRRIEFQSFIADDDLERASGYQYICPEIIQRTAILFRFPAPTATRFHMRNVKAPLKIGFFDGDGLLFQSMVMHPYNGGEEIVYGPMQKFQYALEVRPGFFKEKALSAGTSRLLIETLP